MGIFSKYLYELQVDGQDVGEDEDDFGLDADDGATDEVAPAAEEPAEPATEGDDENEDNFTLEDDDDGNLDDTQGDTEEETADDTPADDTADDDGDDDFSIDDTEGGEEGGAGDAEGGDAPAEGGDDDTAKSSPSSGGGKDPLDGIDDDEKRAAEEAIYDTLTDDQKRIRILQLKIDYKDLYETLMNTIEGVSQIPKNTENLETIKRLNILLVKAKNILISYIDNNFDKNTYLENYTTYLKYIAIFRTTTKVIDELNEAHK